MLATRFSRPLTRIVYRVEFTHHFVTGTLAGIRHPATITFPDLDGAEAWIAGTADRVIRPAGAGPNASCYRVEDPRIVMVEVSA